MALADLRQQAVRHPAGLVDGLLGLHRVCRGRVPPVRASLALGTFPLLGVAGGLAVLAAAGCACRLEHGWEGQGRAG
eukprot:6467448-Alexandrium_andersonii.AAC.1